MRRGGLLAAIAVKMMTPETRFEASTPPPPPDYRDPASWSALPERQDLADRAPPGASSIDQLQAPVDVFYVHPTSYLGSQWNGPTTDPKLNADTDALSTGIQASVFSGCCAIWAPRYRQANGVAFLRPMEGVEQAIDLAYQDVSAAFDVFLARRGADRPFILVSHSQGTVLAERLLEEHISGTPLRDRLVAAYLIGGRVTVAGLAERAPDVPPCASPEMTGCVVAYNAREETFRPNDMEMVRHDTRERLCVNPLTWRMDGAHAPAAANHGAVFLETDDPAPKPGFADAQCVDGTLVVTELHRSPRGFMSRLLDRSLGVGNLHPVEFQLYFMDLRLNAEQRIAAWAASQKEETPEG